MIEMYGFIAAFSAQIIVFSALGPLQLVGRLRRQIEQFIEERAPRIDPSAAAAIDRRLRRLRVLGVGTALPGLVLLALMIRYMLRPDWDDGPLEVVVPAYFVIQVLPTFLAVHAAGRFHEALKRSMPPEKRRALLQRRGLFDFVPRTAVAVAVLVYILHIALLRYIAWHPFAGFAGFGTNAVLVTLLYGVFALGIFMTLRKMASSPLQGREDRLRSVGLVVRVCVYGCILSVINISTNMTLILLDQQRWEPAFASIGLILLGVLMRMALGEQLRIRVDPGSAATAFAR